MEKFRQNEREFNEFLVETLKDLSGLSPNLCKVHTEPSEHNMLWVTYRGVRFCVTTEDVS